MSDINAAIAKYKGWHVANPAFDIGSTWLIAPGRDESDFEYSMFGHKTFEEIFHRYCEFKKEKAPNYLHDANLYMGLFEEMANTPKVTVSLISGYAIDDPTHIKYGVDYCEWVGRGSKNKTESTEMYYDIGTAVCLAFCQLKGIEVVG